VFGGSADEETLIMTSNADVPGDANPSGDVPGEHTAPIQTPHDGEVDESGLSNETSHVVYNPLPANDNAARQQRALRRMARRRTAPPWAKKISWILFPVYGFMRLHDKNYEEHYEQWEEQQRCNYDQQEPL
jgi:hypothetical protein